MAGHSQFKNIMHRKAGQDAKRGKIFTKLIREITTASRQGGPDPDNNPRLRTAIDKALIQNMTKDTINRAIKRGSGEDAGEQMMEIRYEGYGPHGIAVLVDCLTDNKNRTVGEVRHAFTKTGGNLGTSGSVNYLFHQTGIIGFSSSANEDALMEAALEAGATDIVRHEDGSFEVTTPLDQFLSIRDQLVAKGFTAEYAESTWIASTEVSIPSDQQETIRELIDMLEDLDDVQQVYTNATGL